MNTTLLLEGPTTNKTTMEVPYYCMETFELLDQMLTDLGPNPTITEQRETIRRYAIKMTPQPGRIPTPYYATMKVLGSDITFIDKIKNTLLNFLTK